MQVDPINTTLKARGTKRLKLKYDEPLSTFGFNFDSRRYHQGKQKDKDLAVFAIDGGGLHSFNFQLNLHRSCH